MTKYLADFVTPDKTIYIVNSDSQFPKYITITVVDKVGKHSYVKLDRIYLSQFIIMLKEADHI